METNQEEDKADDMDKSGDKRENEVTNEKVPDDVNENETESGDVELAEDSQLPTISAISSHGERKTSESSDSKKPEKLELKSTPIPAPVNLALLDSGKLTERLEKALGSVAPLLREIFVDFAPYLSKTLIGSHGQELLIGGNIAILSSYC